jgi:hypothetical protein
MLWQKQDHHLECEMKKKVEIKSRFMPKKSEIKGGTAEFILAVHLMSCITMAFTYVI